MKEKSVYVVHGYTASSTAEWFPWLKNKLSEANVSTTVFDMPNSNEPIPSEWDAYLDKNITKYDDNTFFVGHSLGCIALLRYLENQSINQKIGGMILVSGFLESVSTLPMLDSFTKKALDITRITNRIKKCIVISSPNDPIVNYQYSCELAKQLNAKLITVENGGHFIKQGGFSEFPLVFDEIFKMKNED